MPQRLETGGVPAEHPTAERRPSAFRIQGAFAGCALIWGSTFLVISVGNDTVPPLWAAALRLALAAPLLLVLARASGQRLPQGAARRAALQYGFLNFGINFSLLYWAETTVSSGLAAVFYATIPLSSTLLARAFGLERITLAKVAAAAIAFAGVAVIFSGSRAAAAPIAPLVALLLAATFAALAGVVLKRGPRQPSLAANAVASMVGCVVCAAGSFALGEPHPLPRTFGAVLPIVYLTIAGSVGAFVLYAWLVNHWDVSRISFVAVIVPVVALLLGAVFRDERLTRASLIGSTLVLVGVLLRIWSDRLEHLRAHQARPPDGARPRSTG